MRLDRTSARTIAAIAAVVGVAACSNKSNPMDDGLKTDLAAVGSQSSGSLQLAPTSANTQVVVSPLEAGEKSAPAPAVHKPVPRPTPKPAKQIAAARQDPVPAPAPAPQPIERAPAAPTPVAIPAPAPQPQPQAKVEPPPLPPVTGRARATDRGGATEAQIFKNMPWIRP